MSKDSQTWIMNTGATNHMISDIGMLNKSTIVEPENPKRISLPNGDTTLVTHTGTSSISDTNIVSNMFYVPQFKYNLLSVSKLTNELQCSAIFFPDFYVF